MPDSAQIVRSDLPPIVKEFAAKDGRFVVLISQDQEGIFRGHSFTWLTDAGDDGWSAFWTQHDFGTFSRDIEVVLGEAQRRIQTYETEHPMAQP